MNRSQAPALHTIDKINFSSPEVQKISSSLEYISVPTNDPTVRFELHFKTGTIDGDLLIASATNNLLLSGTKKLSATQIQDKISLLGAFVQPAISREQTSISIFCLQENFDATMEIVFDILKNVDFPESEIVEYIKDSKQNFLINSEKVSTLANRLVVENIYLNDVRYQRTAKSSSDFETITREKLVEFHQKYYLNTLERIVLVGNLEETTTEKWCKRLSEFSQPRTLDFISDIQNRQQEIFQEKSKAVQSAVRLYFPLFNRKNKDFSAVSILDTILGGYFGSRLMTNIREEKGYTYGINSRIIELNEIGFLTISTEVKTEVKDDVIKEIKHEIKRLQDELISDEELNLVRNYLLGEVLKSADGSDALMDLFLSVHAYGISLDFYNQYIHTIKNITAEQLRTMAQKYLIMENATVVCVG